MSTLEKGGKFWHKHSSSECCLLEENKSIIEIAIRSPQCFCCLEIVDCLPQLRQMVLILAILLKPFFSLLTVQAINSFISAHVVVTTRNAAVGFRSRP